MWGDGGGGEEGDGGGGGWLEYHSVAFYILKPSGGIQNIQIPIGGILNSPKL